MKKWHEIIIGLLLVAVTFFATRYYRNEQILGLQLKFQQQENGIIATTNVLNRGIQNGGKIDLQALANIGWKLATPKPAMPKPDGEPSK